MCYLLVVGGGAPCSDPGHGASIEISILVLGGKASLVLQVV